MRLSTLIGPVIAGIIAAELTGIPAGINPMVLGIIGIAGGAIGWGIAVFIVKALSRIRISITFKK